MSEFNAGALGINESESSNWGPTKRHEYERVMKLWNTVDRFECVSIWIWMHWKDFRVEQKLSFVRLASGFVPSINIEALIRNNSTTFHQLSIIA